MQENSLAFVSYFAKQTAMPPPSDDPDYDLAEDLKRRITPHLEELGIEAFVIIGYAKHTDGKTIRLVAINDGDDAAYVDGLRPAILFAMGWSGMLARPVPPHEKDPKG